MQTEQKPVFLDKLDNKQPWSCPMWGRWDHVWTNCEECEAGYHKHCGDEHDEWKCGGEDD